MPRPTAIVADDEPHLAAQLVRQLAAHWPELQIVGQAMNGPEALELFDVHRPTFAFLDIRMPGMSGLEVARQLAGRCHLVFVTAHDQYAIAAFESAAIDYLLKPVDDERLAKTVARMKERMTSASVDMGTLLDDLALRLRPTPRRLQWLQVQQGHDVLLVPVEDVEIFQASEKYTLAITREQEWVIRTPLKELEDQLDPDHFWRVHRNAIVRTGAIARITRDESGQVILKLRHLPQTIAVSRAYAQRFKQM